MVNFLCRCDGYGLFSLRCEIINWISNLSLQSLPSILSQMPVDAKYQRLELSSIKKKISMPTAFQIQGKPNWFSLLPPLSLFAARFLTERNTRDPIVLQKSDKGQLFDGWSQTCSRISRLFVGRPPCWKKLLIQELDPAMPSTPPLTPFRPLGVIRYPLGTPTLPAWIWK